MRTLLTLLSLVFVSQISFAEEGKAFKSVAGAAEGAVVSVLPSIVLMARNIPYSNRVDRKVVGHSWLFAMPCAAMGGALIHLNDSSFAKESREWLADHKIPAVALSLLASTTSSMSVLAFNKIGVLSASTACALGAVSGAAISGATLAKKLESASSIETDKDVLSSPSLSQPK
jgi:hypothetical protein